MNEWVMLCACTSRHKLVLSLSCILCNLRWVRKVASTTRYCSSKKLLNSCTTQKTFFFHDEHDYHVRMHGSWKQLFCCWNRKNVRRWWTENQVGSEEHKMWRRSVFKHSHNICIFLENIISALKRWGRYIFVSICSRSSPFNLFKFTLSLSFMVKMWGEWGGTVMKNEMGRTQKNITSDDRKKMKIKESRQRAYAEHNNRALVESWRNTSWITYTTLTMNKYHIYYSFTGKNKYEFYSICESTRWRLNFELICLLMSSKYHMKRGPPTFWTLAFVCL